MRPILILKWSGSGQAVVSLKARTPGRILLIKSGRYKMVRGGQPDSIFIAYTRVKELFEKVFVFKENRLTSLTKIINTGA
jgi:hypothetical protein